jgi:DNA-binding transcriptional regulator YhcF (GntR family)
MSRGEIDKFPVGQLPSRYQLARSAVYKRMEQLSIIPERTGQKSYINSAQLRLMDDLHSFIQQGGNAAEFVEARGLRQKPAGRPPKTTQNGNGQIPTAPSSELANMPPEFGSFISAIVSEVVSRLGLGGEPDPLNYFDRLEAAAQNGWFYSTSELAELLDVSPRTIEQQGNSFAEAGFVFSRAGRRQNGETAWRVKKRLR